MSSSIHNNDNNIIIDLTGPDDALMYSCIQNAHLALSASERRMLDIEKRIRKVFCKKQFKSFPATLLWRSVTKKTHRLLSALQVGMNSGSAKTLVEVLQGVKQTVDLLAQTTTEDGFYDFVDAQGKKGGAAKMYKAHVTYVTTLRDNLSTQLAEVSARSPQCALLEAFMNQQYAYNEEDQKAVLFRPSKHFPISRHDFNRLQAWRSLWELAVEAAAKTPVSAKLVRDVKKSVRLLSATLGKWLFEFRGNDDIVINLNLGQKRVLAELVLALEQLEEIATKEQFIV
jgi:hypothetical protein